MTAWNGEVPLSCTGQVPNSTGWGQHVDCNGLNREREAGVGKFSFQKAGTRLFRPSFTSQAILECQDLVAVRAC